MRILKYNDVDIVVNIVVVVVLVVLVFLTYFSVTCIFLIYIVSSLCELKNDSLVSVLMGERCKRIINIKFVKCHEIT